MRSLSGHGVLPRDAAWVGSLQSLTAPSFANPLVILIVSMVIGAIAGYIAGQVANALTKKAAAA